MPGKAWIMLSEKQLEILKTIVRATTASQRLIQCARKYQRIEFRGDRIRDRVTGGPEIKNKCRMKSQSEVSMSIQIECFGFGRKLNVRDSIAGKRIRCPACSANLEVPLEQPVDTPMLRQRPASDPPTRKSQRPDPPLADVDNRPGGVSHDRKNVQPI